MKGAEETLSNYQPIKPGKILYCYRCIPWLPAEHPLDTHQQVCTCMGCLHPASHLHVQVWTGRAQRRR